MSAPNENRAVLLKRLREAHEADVSATKALLKELQAVRKEIRQALQAGPRTVPEIAEAAHLPTDQALWQLMAMKKYGLVTETGLDEGYYRYALAEAAKK